jgi:transposase
MRPVKVGKTPYVRFDLNDYSVPHTAVCSIHKEPMDGAIFVFRNRRRQMLRVLFYDGSGFWLCTKRLSQGRFRNWPTGDGKGPCSPLLARELQILLWGGDPSTCAFPQLWRNVA